LGDETQLDRWRRSQTTRRFLLMLAIAVAALLIISFGVGRSSVPLLLVSLFLPALLVAALTLLTSGEDDHASGGGWILSAVVFESVTSLLLREWMTCSAIAAIAGDRCWSTLEVVAIPVNLAFALLC
jgi:hypothetical protein